MEALEQPTVFFALVLALSLLTERFIEIIKVFFDWLDYQLGFDAFWTRKAQQLHAKIRDKLGLFGKVKPKIQDKTIKRYKDRTLNYAGTYSGKTIVISGDMIRVVFTRAAAKVIGLIFGIFLAYFFQINLIDYINDPEGSVNFTSRHFNLNIFVSGLAIGLGAGPVHKIITTIEKAHNKRKAKLAAKGK